MLFSTDILLVIPCYCTCYFAEDTGLLASRSSSRTCTMLHTDFRPATQKSYQPMSTFLPPWWWLVFTSLSTHLFIY